MQTLLRNVAARARGPFRWAAMVLIAAMLVVLLPIGQISAAGLIDRWWNDLTGGDKANKAEPGTAKAAEPAKPAAAPTPAAATPASQAPASQAPGSQAPAAQTQATPAPAPAGPPIPVVLPKAQAVSGAMVLTGNAAAVNEVKLIARVVGFLDQIHFQDGQFVHKGDLLFTIQQDQYKAQLQQAQAQLQLQQAALFYAKTEVQRYTALVKKDAATQVEVDHWNFEKASAEANIIAAQAQIAIAELNLSYTEVRAPFDGLMGKHLVDPGNVVGGNGQTSALAEITQLDPIYVVANVSTQQALQVRANLDQKRMTLEQIRQIPVEAALQDETGFPHRGTIEYIAPQIDPATGTLYVRGILPNPDRTLLPGVFVNVRLPTGFVDRNALLIPDRSLQEDQGGRYVLVVGPDDVVQQRYVKLGELIGTLRVVTSGLKPDDRVVAGDLWRATPGIKVTPQLTTLPE